MNTQGSTVRVLCRCDGETVSLMGVYASLGGAEAAAERYDESLVPFAWVANDDGGASAGPYTYYPFEVVP